MPYQSGRKSILFDPGQQDFDRLLSCCLYCLLSNELCTLDPVFLYQLILIMSSLEYTEKTKQLPVTERGADSNSSLSSQDEKQSATPSNSVDPESQIPSPPPYHVFTRSRMLQIVCIVSMGAIFSPLSSNVYFPALGAISKVRLLKATTIVERCAVLTLTNLQSLGISMTLTTLTVTVYMIVQGLAPSFWASFSDVIGRRGIFIGTFMVYILSNILLAVSPNYGELMAFRALQAAGSSATISIGAYLHHCHSNIADLA